LDVKHVAQTGSDQPDEGQGDVQRNQLGM
jgi:hypothetical protein